MPTVSRPLQAVKLSPNFVWRSYAGGSVLRRFRGLESGTDDHFPEDWLASCVRARNGANSQSPREGMTHIDGGPLLDWLACEPQFWWGNSPAPRSGTGVLWKLLDSAVRLQLQAHPSATYARKHLNSDAGKTECWYILGTRGDAYVHLGFQRSPGRSEWGRMIRDERTDEMLACFDKIPVQPGDCLVVPAGTPHAIGAGVFMMELQEPTDWVVRCERTNAGLRLPESACFMGLDLEACLDVFNYESISVAEVRQRWQQQPRVVNHGDHFAEEEIIGRAHHEFFRLHRLRGNKSATWSGGEFTLLVATRGEGSLKTDHHSYEVRAGETWLLPGCVEEWQWQTSHNDWEILLAKTPKPDTIRPNP